MFAYIIRPFPFSILGNALLMVIPMNVMIFGLDNLIYLMFPYRQSEEGLQPFIRATLTFTAKGLICLSNIRSIFISLCINSYTGYSHIVSTFYDSTCDFSPV